MVASPAPPPPPPPPGVPRGAEVLDTCTSQFCQNYVSLYMYDSDLGADPKKR